MTRVLGGRASALLVAFFRCLEKARKRVTLPVNVCEVVRASVLTAGCEPVFCDIDAETLCVNLGLAEEALRKDGTIGALLFCHTYGTAVWPSERLADLKRRYGIAVIDDRAAMFPECDDVDGTPADLVLYSTGYAKCVTLPEGGGLGYLAEPFVASFDVGSAVADPAAAKAMKAGGPPSAEWLRSHAWYTSMCPLDEAAYIGRVRALSAESRAHKARLNAIYDAGLRRWKAPQDVHAWRYTLRLPHDRRELALKRVFEAGLFASAHYRPLSEGEYPVAQRLSEEVLNLFNDGYFTEGQAERCVKAIAEVMG